MTTVIFGRDMSARDVYASAYNAGYFGQRIDDTDLQDRDDLDFTRIDSEWEQGADFASWEKANLDNPDAVYPGFGVTAVMCGKYPN